MLLANYHTHTTRCNHATGDEREYIENAIRAGLVELGFSDHAPMVFHTPGYYSGFRIRPERFEDYVTTLRALKEEYAGQIKIRIGLEVEYYPELFQDFLDYIRPYGIEYLIMGQHFLGNEIGEKPSGMETDDESRLARFVDQVSEGMRTGKFSYVAHPDMMPFKGDPDVYAKQVSRLIDCSLETETPLEINFLGIRGKRAYPNPKFWEQAGKQHALCVFGCDAHSPDVTADLESLKVAEQMVKQYGLRHVDFPVLKNPNL